MQTKGELNALALGAALLSAGEWGQMQQRIRLGSGTRRQKPARPKNSKRAKVKAARKARLRNQGLPS